MYRVEAHRCLASAVSHASSARQKAVVVYHDAGKRATNAPTKKPPRSPVSGQVGESPVLQELPSVGSIRVKSAEFVKSSVAVKDCPKEDYPEFAVVGRSNVGKSSLINLLTGRKKLALISKTPGKTKCMNHFLINERWYLVDMPGYGYSKVRKARRLEWNAFTREYFLQRGTLANVLLLVDASIAPIPLDLYCAEWLAEAEVPFTVVFTKVDKRKTGPKPQENIEAFRTALSEQWTTLPPCFATSARFREGNKALLEHICRLAKLFRATDRRKFGLGWRFSDFELEQISRSD